MKGEQHTANARSCRRARRVAGLVLCALAVCAVGVASAQERTVEDILPDAKAAEKVGDSATAFDLWKRAWKLAPKADAEGRKGIAGHVKKAALGLHKSDECRLWAKRAGASGADCGPVIDDKLRKPTHKEALPLDPKPTPQTATNSTPTKPTIDWSTPAQPGEERDGLVFIPAGEFQMGSNHGGSNEKPVHAVKLSGYWLGLAEVTEADYRKWLGAKHGKVAKPTSGSDYCNYGNTDRGGDPINCVTWQEAEDYCADRYPGGRLPWEAEWEYAARGPSTQPDGGREFPWSSKQGDSPDGHLCWNRYGNKQGTCHTVAFPLGSTPAPYSIADLAGNVWEWTGDCYDEKYYSQSEEKDPHGPRKEGCARAVRGGGWNINSAWYVRGAHRNLYDPLYRDYGVGFRCTRGAQ